MGFLHHRAGAFLTPLSTVTLSGKETRADMQNVRQSRSGCRVSARSIFPGVARYRRWFNVVFNVISSTIAQEAYKVAADPSFARSFASIPASLSRDINRRCLLEDEIYRREIFRKLDRETYLRKKIFHVDTTWPVSISASRAGRKSVKSSGRIVRRANFGFIAHFNVSDTRTEARHDSARMLGLA